MTKIPTATKIKDLNTYAGEVAVFELSRGIKKGAITFKHLVVARYTPRSGKTNTSVFLSDEKGAIRFTESIKEMRTSSMTDAFDQLGYTLK